jgi:hypothetical protein
MAQHLDHVGGARDCCSPLMKLSNTCGFSLFRSIFAPRRP